MPHWRMRALVGLGRQEILHVPRELAPEVGGIPELDLAIHDPEVYGLGRLASHDDAVEAGVFQLGPPVPASFAFAVAIRQRRFRGDTEAGSPGERDAG